MAARDDTRPFILAAVHWRCTLSMALSFLLCCSSATRNRSYKITNRLPSSSTMRVIRSVRVSLTLLIALPLSPSASPTMMSLL
jgi:hypothetical protein